ncbi:cupin-like domain-containing protein [Pedobacter sp. MR2016-24]|uniref:cupin-like domain-containing protein n=1 Tax=Pedobacter sp. MR2016-24 TaxID=2994466 RepID=UPI0022476644|nr:cupin-like domain-containing protein [Pedobacter sp. MR2016-24]MCX2484247.1 cupin-like domain-containing protein [Pedobacter sp. MR2016-24]
MEVQRKSNISYEEFMEEHHNPGIPLVFTDASKVWKANGLFTPDWFRENYPDRESDVTDKLTGKPYTIKEVMDLVEQSSLEKPAPYPLTFNINTKLPELLDLLSPLNLNYAKPNWLEDKLFQRGHWGGITELFVGGPGGRFPYVHKDYYHLSAWINQLYGEKEFTVFPRGQEEFLYVNGKNQWRSEVNMFEPDYDKHPKFKNATPIRFTVGAGETLYIPFGMWHSAYSLNPTISVAFDQLNSKNFPMFLSDVWNFKKEESGTVKALAASGYAIASSIICKLKG